MKKVLFIDRDGTIIKEPTDEQVDSFEKFSFIANAISSLGRIATETDFILVMVTNQDGLGTHLFPEDTFWPVQNKMLEILASEGVTFDDIYIDWSLPQDNSPSRKPGVAMLGKYIHGDFDLKNSYVIGDRFTDIQLAANLGAKAIALSEKKMDGAALSTSDWNEIYRFLKAIPRTATAERSTKETFISVELNLDGTGKSEISTGIGFLDHMLEQIARHGSLDLKVKARGDLAVDEHHTAEDIAIVLGEAFLQALGSKKGISRYGFLLPMDDCLAQVAIDFGGRPWLVWDVTLKREKIGEMPTEMFMHFFKSFSDSARCNLNIKAEGENEHHKIEAVFKAFSKAVGMAVSKTRNNSIPSTKGTL